MKVEKKSTTSSLPKLIDLKKECKDLGVKSTGTRNVLQKRIQTAKFLQKISSSSTMIQVREYSPSVYQEIIPYERFYSLLFKNNIVIGKLDIRKDKVSPITKQDIEYCKFHQIPYALPSVLVGEQQRHRIKEILEESDDDEDLS
jgi:hypothetical protein